MLSRKGGSSGAFSQSGRIAGITGQSRFTNCRRKAYSSLSCQGPRPFLPTKTAADLILPICSSSNGCHGSPGRSSHSSSQGRIPCSLSFAPISFTAVVALVPWAREKGKAFVFFFFLMVGWGGGGVARASGGGGLLWVGAGGGGGGGGCPSLA